MFGGIHSRVIGASGDYIGGNTAIMFSAEPFTVKRGGYTKGVAVSETTNLNGKTVYSAYAYSEYGGGSTITLNEKTIQCRFFYKSGTINGIILGLSNFFI